MGEDEISLSPFFYFLPSLCFSLFIFFAAFLSLAIEVCYQSLTKSPAVLLHLPGQSRGLCLNLLMLKQGSRCPAWILPWQNMQLTLVLSVAVSGFLCITSYNTLSLGTLYSSPNAFSLNAQLQS